MSETLDHFIRQHAADRPDKVFWRQISGPAVTETSFAAFRLACLSYANCYRELGLVPGEIVLIFLPQQVTGVAAFFGAMLAGVVPSFMPCPSAKQQPSVYWPAHRALIARIGPALLVTDAANAGPMRRNRIVGRAGILTIDAVAEDHRELPARADADAVALLQHSSGTTSLKKGVALSHRAILRQVDSYASRLRMGADDNIVSWLPVYHDMGLIAATVTPLVLGQTVTCLSPFEWVARPASLFEALEHHQGHFTWLPNFAFEHLVRSVPDTCDADLSGVRAFIDCSEPCRAETFDRFAQRFAVNGVRPDQLQVCYAMAETVFAVTQTEVGTQPTAIELDAAQLYGIGRAMPAKAGSASVRLLSNGAPLDGISVHIQEAGRDLPDGHAGQIMLSGGYLFYGYFNDPLTTAERLADGLYNTRDRGFVQDGQLYVLGRTDDLLIVNGRNLHAHEVEAIVAGVPALKPGRAVAFGVFSPVAGSDELVVVAERDPDALSPGVRHLAKRIRRLVYEQTNIEVKACRIVEPGWLVKTTSGKISRQANQAKYLAEAATAVPDATVADDPALPVLQRLAAVIANAFGYPAMDVRRQTVADDVEGWDSLSHASLILRVEQCFGIRFADSEIFGFADVGALADRVEQLLRTGPAVDATADRLIFKNQAATIVRLGGGDGPDVVVFAGKETIPGDMDMASFSSIFAGFNNGHSTQYYVTDKVMDFYISCFEDVVREVNARSDRPKILFGNSMGGYAALRFATRLTNVISVLALVPHAVAPAYAVRGKPGVARSELPVRLVPGVHYCLLYGTEGDYRSHEVLRGLAQAHGQADVVVVPNCGHNLVRYVHRQKMLRDMVAATLQPDTMARDVGRVVSRITPDWHDPDWLALRFRKAASQDGRLTLDQAKNQLPVVLRNFAMLDPQGRGYVTLGEVIEKRLQLA